MQGAILRPRQAFAGAESTAGGRLLAEEVAVALSYGGTTQAVMMATPADLMDFAIGFTVSEGLALPTEIEGVVEAPAPQGIDLQVLLRGPAQERLAARRRWMAGPVGCGLCGIDSLAEAVRAAPQVGPDDGPRLRPSEIVAAIRALAAQQPLHQATRAVHAAGLLVPGAGLVLVREDVGRHNALDKLIGALVRSGRPRIGAVVVSSRISIDLVQKCARAGLAALIGASAPTAAAVATAEAAGLALIGSARGEGFELFCGAGRLNLSETANVA